MVSDIKIQRLSQEPLIHSSSLRATGRVMSEKRSPLLLTTNNFQQPPQQSIARTYERATEIDPRSGRLTIPIHSPPSCPWALAPAKMMAYS